MKTFVSFVFALVVTVASAAQTDSAGSQFSGSPEQLVASASSPKAPSEGDVLVVVEEEHYRIDEQHRTKYEHHQIYKILNNEPNPYWTSISVSYEPWHQAKPVVVARVVDSAGKQHMLDQKTMVDAAVQNEDDIFSDRREVRAPIPAASAGSVVEIVTTLEDKEPLFTAGVVRASGFGFRKTVVEKSVLVLDFPSSMKVRYQVQLLPELKTSKSERDGRTELRFEMARMEPLKPVDSNVPFGIATSPGVSFSTADSWAAIAAAYDALVEEQVAASNLQDWVAHITSGKRDRAERIQALVEALHKEVRYTGVEFGQAALVPRAPAETLKRKFGDCKDKSVLLVAMLRAAGIQAHMALLDSGFGHDMYKDLPGMGEFDHAVVYVPGSPDYWIDATDQYARAGAFNVEDRGRLALIAAKDTAELTRTPDVASSENHFTESRTVLLSNFGPGKIVERTSGTGLAEANLRSNFGKPPTKEQNKDLEDYLKDQYFAEALTKYERGDAADFQKEFFIALEGSKIRRAKTGLDTASVGIWLPSIATRMPESFWEEEQPERENQGQSELVEKRTKRSQDFLINAPFVTEWQYTLVPPAGFQADTLPKDNKRHFGPASLSESYELGNDGSVKAHFIFDSGKRQYSLEEFKETRKAFHEWHNGNAVLITFSSKARVLLRGGKTRQAIETLKEVAQQNQKQAVNHMRLAQVLLEAGLGEAARAEAKHAVELEPTFAPAFRTLAFTMEHDLLGRHFKKGFDPEAAESAFKKAIQLEPDENETKAQLAALYEYDHDGTRYSSKARLKDAFAQFESIKDKLGDVGYETFPPFDLLYTEQYARLRDYVQAVKLGRLQGSMLVVSTAMLESPAAAVSQATTMGSSEADRNQYLTDAAQMLMKLRHYPQAKAMLEAAATNSESAAALISQARLMGVTQRIEDRKASADDPKQLVQEMFLQMLLADDPGDAILKLFSRNVTESAPAERKRQVKAVGQAALSLRYGLAKGGMPMAAMAEILLATIEMNVEGDGEHGLRVRTVAGGKKSGFFIVKEGSSLKLVDDDSSPNAIGLEILDRIDKGDLISAKRFLDWLRETQNLSGGDDPFSGKVFPRFWTKGDDPDPARMRLAAAAIAAGGRFREDHVPVLLHARETAQTDAEKQNIDLALALAYNSLNKPEEELPVSQRLLAAKPTSLTALQYLTTAARRTKRWDAWEAALAEREKHLPDDPDTLRSRSRLELYRGDIPKGVDSIRKVIASGHSEPADYNELAWFQMVKGEITKDTIDTAEKAAELSQNHAPGILHTVACIYARTDHPAEAKRLLLTSMDLWATDEPNSEIWFGLGEIAQDLGYTDAAVSAFKRVEKPEEEPIGMGSSYDLAQQRLAAFAKSSH